jgi:hypothetical protein
LNQEWLRPGSKVAHAHYANCQVSLKLRRHYEADSFRQLMRRQDQRILKDYQVQQYLSQYFASS